MKRFFIIFTVISLLVSFLVIPAAATDTESDTSAYQPQYISLLDYALEYTLTFTLSDGTSILQVTNDPVAQLNNSRFSTLSFSWGDRDNRLYFDYALVGIETASRPNSVSLNNIVGSLVGVGGGVYFYRFDLSGARYAEFLLSLDVTGLSGVFNISSAFCVVDNSVPIDEANLVATGQLASDGQRYIEEFFGESVTLPYTYTKSFDSASPTVSPEQFWVDVDFPMPVPYADCVSITFISPNIWPNYYDQDTLSQGGVYISQSGQYVESLPYTVSDAITGGSWYGMSLYLYTVTVDLTGVDLSDQQFLHFRTYLGAVYPNTSTSSNFHVYYFQVVSASYKLTVANKPWYVRFFYWIQNEFASLKQTINAAFGTDQTVPDTSDQEEQNNQVIEDQEQSNDELQGIIDGLEEAPTVPDFDETGLGEFGGDVNSDLIPVQSVFVVIFENPVIYQMITYVFMFGLGGFLLFGER